MPEALLKLVETLRIARRCRGILWQNFAGTLAVLFILNSTRLVRPGETAELS